MYSDYVDIENLKEIMPDANNFMTERIKKLAELECRGINPYPYGLGKTTTASFILEQFDSITEEQLFTLGGRILLIRKMGSAAFMNIRDRSGEIQLYFNKALLGEEKYDILRFFDIGDIIGLEGSAFRTKSGEITIRVTDYSILCKAIRPLPEKFHGIQDTDLRQRHRSLDMIMNKGVKERFIKRAKGMAAVREFMTGMDFIEAETPVLDTKYGGGEAKPFVTYVNALDSEVFMNVSPELYLKRLMVGGIDRVYTIGRSFRNEGIDRSHYPEFTLLECYMAYADYTDMMRLMENLYDYVFTKVNGSTVVNYENVEIDFKAPWKRARMCELVKADTGLDVEFMSREAIVEAVNAGCLLPGAASKGFEVEAASKGELILQLFEEYCEAKLIQPTFVMDFPRESSPLCKVHRGNPELIERFEPYTFGIELGNAYSELNDPLRQRILLHEQAGMLRAGLETASPMDEEFAVAIDTGMPPAGGLGIGIDRMMMFLTESYSIRDVIAFPLVKR